MDKKEARDRYYAERYYGDHYYSGGYVYRYEGRYYSPEGREYRVVPPVRGNKRRGIIRSPFRAGGFSPFRVPRPALPRGHIAY